MPVQNIMSKNRTFRLSEAEWEQLQQTAKTFKFTYSGKGSVNKLLKAIASNELVVCKNLSRPS